MSFYYRPVAQTDPCRPAEALPLAGGWCWFDRVEEMSRGRPGRLLPVRDLPPQLRDRLTAPRAPLAGLQWDQPRLMGILNVTPDSFSDGGLHFGTGPALAHAEAMVAAGADILDIGGESTRPGAAEVPVADELARVIPAITAIRARTKVPISIDTRKAAVAQQALGAGARLLNDVSALGWDDGMAQVAADSGAPLCLMHAQGDPRTMQQAPQYDDVLFDVYDYLEERIAFAQSRGIARDRLVVDPGIGFGKTLEHNLRLIRCLSLFHTLGCVLLLGVSRKRFIGTIAGVESAAERTHGSVALALEGVRQGVQILRVHDMTETRQALSLWRAATH